MIIVRHVGVATIHRIVSVSSVGAVYPDFTQAGVGTLTQSVRISNYDFWSGKNLKMHKWSVMWRKKITSSEKNILIKAQLC